MTILQYPPQITFADSPCLIVLEDENLPIAVVTGFQIQLFIWRGDISSIPTNPEYTFNIEGIEQPHLNNSTFKYGDLEIGRFLKEYIKDGYIENDNIYNGDNGCWYSTIIESNVTSPITSDTHFTTLGYSSLQNGVNKGTTILEENGQAFGNQGIKLVVSSDEDYIVPVYVGLTSSNLFFNNNLTSVSLQSLGITASSTLSQEQIGYVNFGKTLFGNQWTCGTKFRYDFSNSIVVLSVFTYTFPIQLGGVLPSVPEEEYDVLVEKTQSNCKLKYRNSYGAYTELPCNGQFYEDLQIKRVTYQNEFLNPYDLDYDRHFERTQKVNGTKTFKVNTGWIFEESNIMVEELLLSKNVYLKVDGINYPVTITDSSKKYIDRRFKKQVGYSFNCKVNKQYKNLIR